MKWREVGEGEEVRQRLRVRGDLGVGVLGRQFGHDAGRGRPDVVHVQFGLGQPRDEGVQIVHRILRVLDSAGLHRPHRSS